MCRPSNEADASPFRNLSRSAWIELVWRTPSVYSEFMVSTESKRETKNEAAGWLRTMLWHGVAKSES